MKRILIEGQETANGIDYEVMQSWEAKDVSVLYSTRAGDSRVSFSKPGERSAGISLPKGPYNKLTVEYINTMLGSPELQSIKITDSVIRQMTAEFARVECVLVDKLEKSGTPGANVGDLREHARYSYLMIEETNKKGGFVGQEKYGESDVSHLVGLTNVREKLQEQREGQLVAPAISSASKASLSQ